MINTFIHTFFNHSLSKTMTRFVALLVLFASPLSAVAELELRISKTTNDGIPIYLANIPGGANGIIEANLKRSGRFTIVNRSKIKNLPPYGKPLNGGVYTDIADYIVRGTVLNGVLEIELTSTSDNAKKLFKITSDRNKRRIAHEASDVIYERITREKGAFDTKLAYVTVTNVTNQNREFRLFVSDADGHNSFEISKTPYLMMSPSWSPDAQLYRMSINGGKKQRLTFDGKSNSAADIANNKLAFVRDNRHIAIRAVNTAGADRLSNGQFDDSPTLSPNGAMIAYTTMRNGENALAVISDNGKSRQFLTSPVGDIREPAWSPYLNQ